MCVELIKEQTPTARKQHHCYFCGGLIEVGTKYNRSTNVYDGRIYDWISHIVCEKVAHELDMYSNCDDDGLSADSFSAYIDEYVYENHYDNDIDDIAEDWQLSTHEQVIKIASELKL